MHTYCQLLWQQNPTCCFIASHTSSIQQRVITGQYKSMSDELTHKINQQKQFRLIFITLCPLLQHILEILAKLRRITYKHRKYGNRKCSLIYSFIIHTSHTQCKWQRFGRVYAMVDGTQKRNELQLNCNLNNCTRILVESLQFGWSIVTPANTKCKQTTTTKNTQFTLNDEWS